MIFTSTIHDDKFITETTYIKNPFHKFLISVAQSIQGFQVVQLNICFHPITLSHRQ